MNASCMIKITGSIMNSVSLTKSGSKSVFSLFSPVGS